MSIDRLETLKLCRPHTSRNGEWVPVENGPDIVEIVRVLLRARNAVQSSVEQGDWICDNADLQDLDALLEKIEGA